MGRSTIATRTPISGRRLRVVLMLMLGSGFSILATPRSIDSTIIRHSVFLSVASRTDLTILTILSIPSSCF